MRIKDESLSTSPTDLANFLTCRRKTTLDLRQARGLLEAPDWEDPLAVALRERGIEHEQRYVESLRAQGLTVEDLSARKDAEARVGVAMREGVDVIVQAPLRGEGWFGYADVLRRVARASALGDWSYEVHDAKLTRETRGGTILQLCVYTELVAAVQELTAESFCVVTPDRIEAYRFDEYAAFFRHVRARFLATLASERQQESGPIASPDAVDHCEVCRWWETCNRQRRRADHLSFVAGIGRLQQNELEGRAIGTLAALSKLPLPIAFKPARGSPETYVRLREQARLQREQRETGRPVYELLPLERATPDAAPTNPGLARLPEPSPGDLFLDLEGDPFVERATDAGGGSAAAGREYLFGLGRILPDGSWSYRPYWAWTDAEERKAFEAVVDEITAVLAVHPGAHVYHYAPYEPSAFKRLMGRYASRESEIDSLLRGGRLVDLCWVVKHALRAGVESYSIKRLEPFYGFVREVDLERAGDERRLVEQALETGDASSVSRAVCEAVEGYNADDCRSTLALRNWLERLRAGAIASGTEIPRPVPASGDASEKVTDRQARVEALRSRLLIDVPPDRAARTPEEQARYLLAYSLDWHNREDKSAWWEYFRLTELSDEELLDEAGALAGLEFVEEVGAVKKSVIARYRYPEQEMEIRRGDTLKLKTKTRWGKVEAVDRSRRTIDVLVGPTARAWRPASAFVHDYVSSAVIEESLFALGEAVAGSAGPSVATDLLTRRSARLRSGGVRPAPDESVVDFAVRIAGDLDGSVLAIQGPPGSGKTFTGARMICELVRQGKTVGITATGHAVIRNLLEAVAREAAVLGVPAKLAQRRGTDEAAGEDAAAIVVAGDNETARTLIASGERHVLGGTAWLWARPEFAGAVDVLFVDEAGQMSLANVLGVARAGRSLVLLGDPQQLEQPKKGSHPDGVDVSALQHILGEHKTMPPERGLFLPETWRLAPAICTFTSEVFYEGKLCSRPGLERQVLRGLPALAGAGLWVETVEHDGCRNVSDQEVERVTDLIGRLLAPGSEWVDAAGAVRSITPADILVVAPYNAHVNRLRERLQASAPGVAVGTVDKFQGQEAPVVIYSMATSRPEDAPRGMEFLYSLNRLNVATSRARCACILVANARLFEPECRTPRQMQLASALSRYRELGVRPA